ncbi:uncharacterized protein LOC126330079 isoform X2 [Schistocerca gregaria]|nr:uncharacterized protein LOC126330079 isoform X2 [Schistocerca gregaria]
MWAMEGGLANGAPEKLGKLNSAQLFQKLNGRKVSGTVEQVKSGSSLRLSVPSLGRTVLVFLSGVECEAYNPELSDELQKPYARAAHFFVELLVLNCEVTLVLESINELNQLLGAVWIGRCNLGVRLLEEGLATYDHETAGMYAAELSQAEVKARESGLGIWRRGGVTVPRAEKKEMKGESVCYEGRVTGIINTGGIRVADGDLAKGGEHRLYFSSIYYPRYQMMSQQANQQSNSSIEVYVAKMCREYLRQLLIGQTIQYSLDYTRSSNKDGEEFKFYSVWFEGKNVALELVSRGFARVMAHREGEQRSPIYQKLLIAENQAKKKQHGLHSTETIRLPVVNYLVAPPSASRRDPRSSESRKRTQEQGDMHYVSRLQSHLQKLRRAGKLHGVVEKVVNPIRFSIWIDKEAILMPFHLNSLSIPPPTHPGNAAVRSAAHQFVHDSLYQRDVYVTVESIDRLGDFSGQLYLNSLDFGQILLQKGFAKFWTLRKSVASVAQYRRAEEEAKQLKLGFWEHWSATDVGKNASKEADQQQESSKREKKDLSSLERFPVLVTCVAGDFQFYFQKLDDLTSPSPEASFLEELQQLPAPDANFSPSKSTPLASLSPSDNKWHRASLERVSVDDKYFVHFLDLGERRVVSKDAIRPLPPELQKIPPVAQSARLAYVVSPKAGDSYYSECTEFFSKTASGRTFLCCTHYQEGKVPYVVLHEPSSESTVNATLVENGFAVLDRQFDEEPDDDQFVSQLREKQKLACDKRLGMWEYQNEIHLDSEDY